jgi:hypothetical protein
MLNTALNLIPAKARGEDSSIIHPLRLLPGNPVAFANVERPVVREVSVGVELKCIEVRRRSHGALLIGDGRGESV